MQKFQDKALQSQYDSDSSFRANVDKTETQYQQYVEKAKYMQKDLIMEEPMLERFMVRENQTIYFFYGCQQPTPAKDRTKLTLNFIKMFHLEPKERFVFVYFNHKTPSSDYFLQFKNIFMLLPLSIIDKMDQFILVKPYFYIKAVNFIQLGGIIQKYFGKHYKTTQNCTELCKILNIKPRQFASFVPEMYSQQFPPQFKKKPSLPTYRINLAGQNLTETQINDRQQFQLTIQSLIKKQVYKLQNYELGELGIPIILQLIISYFHNKPNELNQQGIFRKCVSIDEETETLTELCKRNYEYLQSIQNPFLIAVLIKKFFHNLKQPIIPFKAFPLLMHDQGITNKKIFIRDIAATFPQLNRLTLIFLIDFLKKDVISKQHSNKMTLNNVAICFAPCLMRPEQTATNSTADLIYATKSVAIINVMLTQTDFIFGSQQQRQNLFKMSVIQHNKKFQETIRISLSMDYHDTQSSIIKGVQFNESIVKKQQITKKTGVQVNQKKGRKKSSSELSNEIKEIQNRFAQRKKESQNETKQPKPSIFQSTIFIDEPEQTTSFFLQEDENNQISYVEKVVPKHEPYNNPALKGSQTPLQYSKSSLGSNSQKLK